MDKSAWTQLTRSAFELETPLFDDMVLETPGIDPFCSSSFWILSAADALHEKAITHFWQHPMGYLSLARHYLPQWGQILMPLEAAWCLASPLITNQPETFIHLLANEIRRESGWDTLFLAGLSLEGRLWQALVKAFRGYIIYRARESSRCQASLQGGMDGYLGRRTAKFRKNMRRSQRAAASAGIRFEWSDRWTDHGEMQFFETAMDLEARSWKGIAGEGVNQGQMRRFYANMLPRLASRSRFRAVTAHLEDKLVGFAFGGVFGDRFRGLQFSYLPEWKSLSLGNLMQLQLVAKLCEEGIKIYDLGMDMPYKHRWSETLMTTHSLIVKR